MTRSYNHFVRLTMTSVLGAAVLLAAGAAQAAQRVTIEKNHTMRVTLRGTAGSVIVGNPDIADVSVIDSHTLYIVAKGLGSSAVNVTDAAGRSLFDGEVVVMDAPRSGITVYKGLTPTSVICTNVCVSVDNSSAAAPTPAPAAEASN